MIAPTTLDVGRSHLLVIDVQERLLPAMGASAAACRGALRLLGTASRLLGVPVTVTEHVPGAIGRTVPEVMAFFDPPTVVEKVRFGAAYEPDLRARLEAFERPHLVVAGLETHVCVLQTVLGLLDQGHAVHVVADACRSRRLEDHERGLHRMERHGAEIVTAEMVAFEWLRRADHPARSAVIKAVKTTTD